MKDRSADERFWLFVKEGDTRAMLRALRRSSDSVIERRLSVTSLYVRSWPFSDSGV